MLSHNTLGGMRVIFFYAWGYASRKRLGTAGVDHYEKIVVDDEGNDY
jgi:hypothetical protein